MNSDMLANLNLTSVELVCAYEFKELFKKLFIRTSYCLYLIFRSRLIIEQNTAAKLPKKSICRKTKAHQKHLRPPY